MNVSFTYMYVMFGCLNCRAEFSVSLKDYLLLKGSANHFQCQFCCSFETRELWNIYPREEK